MTRVPFSPHRVGLIAWNTLLEASRQKLFHFLLLLALGFVAGAWTLRDFNFGAPELKFLEDFGFGAMAFFGAALTIAAMAQLFFSEIENRTALTLLAKPVWRAEFILGKYLGVVAVIAVFCVLVTALLAAVLVWRETGLRREMGEAFPKEGAVDYAKLAAAGALQYLKLAVLAAFTLLVASFAQTQLYTTVAGCAVLVICHLQYLAQEVYAHAGSVAARLVGGAIGLLFPNFQLFNLVNELSAGAALPWERVARVSLYAGGYIAATVVLGAYSFRQREI